MFVSRKDKETQKCICGLDKDRCDFDCVYICFGLKEGDAPIQTTVITIDHTISD